MIMENRGLYFPFSKVLTESTYKVLIKYSKVLSTYSLIPKGTTGLPWCQDGVSCISYAFFTLPSSMFIKAIEWIPGWGRLSCNWLYLMGHFSLFCKLIHCGWVTSSKSTTENHTSQDSSGSQSRHLILWWCYQMGSLFFPTSPHLGIQDSSSWGIFGACWPQWKMCFEE